MYGTFAGALSARNVQFDRPRFTADVEGRIEGIGRTIRITGIHVRYHVRVPHDDRDRTERALATHPERCPAHQSVKDAIRITYEAEIEEF